MNKELSDETMLLLQYVSENVEKIWLEMLEDGFSVDSYTFDYLSKLEPNTKGLLPVKKYFYELIKERLLSFHCAKYGRSFNGYRSEYLDWLDFSFKSNTWDYTSVELYTQPSLMQLFSNTIKYSKSEQEFNIYKNFYDGFIDKAYQDIVRMREIQPDSFYKEIELSKKGLNQIVGPLLFELDFDMVKLKRGPQFLVYSRKLPNELGFLSICIDSKVWKVNHKWDVSFAISSEPITEPFVYSGYSLLPVMFDLEVFCPSALLLTNFATFNYEYSLTENKGGYTVEGVDNARNLYAGLYLQSFLKSLVNLLSKPK